MKELNKKLAIIQTKLKAKSLNTISSVSFTSEKQKTS